MMLQRIFQSTLYHLIAFSLILLISGILSNANAFGVTELWSTPSFSTTRKVTPNQYSFHNIQKFLKHKSGCPTLKIPALINNIPTAAFKINRAGDLQNTLVLMDPITEHVMFIHRSLKGCHKVIVSGRAMDFQGRDILSPFPNSIFTNISQGDEILAIIQDRKTIRPWFQWFESDWFKKSSYIAWMLVAAYCGVLIVIAVSASFIDPTGRKNMALAYILYVIALVIWVMQNFGLGQAWIPFWPGVDSFKVIHAFSVSFLVVAIGTAVIQFLELPGIIRKILTIGVALSGLAFFSSAWVVEGYKLGSFLLAPMSLIVIWQLIAKSKKSDLSIRLFSLGVATAMLGGGMQAYSVISSGYGLNWIAVFAFPMGSFVQAIFWMASLSSKIKSDRVKLQEKLVFDAEHDVLTRLPNRVYLKKRLQNCLVEIKNDPQTVFGLLFIDLDRFKVINDSLGHGVGDRLLQAISNIISEIATDSCTVARFGGDVFLVLIEKPCNEQTISELASRLVKSLSSPITLDDWELRVNSSIGLVLITDYYEYVDSVIRDADTALQVAKQSFRGQYVTFDPIMRQRVEQRFHLEHEIQRGIEQNEFRIYFQPIILLETETHAGFEALVRWENPSRGLVGPGEFIPIAEDTGTIRELGKIILQKTIEIIGTWRREGLWKSGWYVSINISGKQLYDDSLTHLIDKALVDYGVHHQDIRLELTETSVIENQHAVDVILPKLRDDGIKLCMDDFGTGYSSLSYLKILPFDVIKIDKSFIDEIENEAQSRALVKTVLTLARDMGFLVVAEGVETEAQKLILSVMNCDYVQGYYFSKPVPEHEATKWLEGFCDIKIYPDIAKPEIDQYENPNQI